MHIFVVDIIIHIGNYQKYTIYMPRLIAHSYIHKFSPEMKNNSVINSIFRNCPICMFNSIICIRMLD